MGGTIGREIVAAFVKYGTWRTVSGAPGAGTGLLLRTLPGQARQPDYPADESLGINFIKRYDKGGVQPVTTDLTAYDRYQGLDVLLAIAMGTAGTPTSMGSGAYYNTYTLKDRVDGLFGTLFAKHTVDTGTDKVWAYPSVKVGGFTIHAVAGQPTEISFHQTANDCDIDNATSMASVTVPTLGNRLMGGECQVRMNAQSGGALGSGDVIQPAEWTLTYKRPMDAEHVTDGDQTIIEPVETGFADLSLSMRFPRYNTANHAFLTALGNDTRQKCDITFTGALIGGANYYMRRYRFPHLVVTNIDAPKSGPAIVPLNIEFKVAGVESAVTGMTGLLTPFDCYVQNTRATDPLS